MIKGLAYFDEVLTYFDEMLILSLTSPSNQPLHPVCLLAGRFRAMANQLDPHHLVALMCYEFKSAQDGSAHHLNRPLGIVDHYRTSAGTRTLMNALTHISVSQPYSQVVALALQLKPGSKEIRIMIAENQDVGDSLVNHLYNVWGKLQALSEEYAGHRAEAWDENQRTKELDKDPMLLQEIPFEVGQPLKIEIFRDIYQYCLRKQMKRSRKWLGKLSNFMKELDKRRKGTGLGGSEQNLLKAGVALMFALKLVSKLSRGKQLTDREWEEVYWQSMSANKSVKLVLVDKGELGYQKLASELKGMRLVLLILFSF